MTEYSEKYKELGEAVRAELFPHLEEFTIAWVESDKKKKNKGRLTFADTRTVQDEYKFCCPYDFVIIFYTPNCDQLDNEGIKILIEHELLHCGQDTNGEPMVLPHDIEDFMQIINKYGIEWCLEAQKEGFDFDIDI